MNSVRLINCGWIHPNSCVVTTRVVSTSTMPMAVGETLSWVVMAVVVVAVTMMVVAMTTVAVGFCCWCQHYRCSKQAE